MKDKPRIGCGDNSRRIEVYNANWSATGERIGNYERPWNVFTPWDCCMFPTYREALEYALKEAGNK